jgi:2',3'-cyclic-nucleotide 2'-phosphodiesterase (5'-nucleotidase family)
MMTQGEAIINLMNAVKYDVAIPGNHEFDYGMHRFLELTEKADFPYISCNITKDGKLVLEPYVIREAAGIKVAFVGVTTPNTLVTSNPGNFKDENGNTIYGFMQDASG